jgi:hypothetical protein
MKIDVQATLARRAEALLEMRMRALAREGKPIADAFRKPIPVKMRPLR